MSSPIVTFHDGGTMPAVSFGTWGGGGLGVPEAEEVAKAARLALECGYRSIDCAESYGNEAEVGDVLKSAMKDGLVTREAVFMTSKLWNTNHDPSHVREACLNTLRNLQLDYLDLFLVHWPVAWEYCGPAPFAENCPTDENGEIKTANVAMIDTWRAMEALVDEGKVKYIGVSNFSAQMLGDLMTYARVKPVTNQVECHPYFQQRNMLKLLQKYGMVLMAYSPLGRPGQVSAPGGDSLPVMLEDTKLTEIAAARGVDTAAVVIAWGVQRGTVAIPKSSHPERMKTNLSGASLRLTDEEMAAIDSIDQNIRYVDVMWQQGCSLFSD